MLTRTELAWAAGFIDGEGCFYATINGRGSVRAILSVSQRIPEPLNNLQKMFCAGTINNIVNKGNPAHIITFSRQIDLIRVIGGIRPYLRCKADQADVLLEIVEHMVEHGGRGRYSTIDKDWCAKQVVILKAQKRPWKT